MINKDPLFLSNTIINLSKTNTNEAIKMVETIKEDNISQETIYQVAKNVYRVNKYLAIQLINIIIHNRKYFSGWRAYTDCIKNDEKAIDDMINYKKITFQTGLIAGEEYIEDLSEIAFSIAEYYPSKAKDLLEEINNVQKTMNKVVYHA